MTRIAIALGILLLSSPALSADVSGSGGVLERMAVPPGIARSAYDLVALRPLGFVQVVGSAAVFVVAYPVSLLVGGSQTVKEVCLTGPVDQVFRAELGDF